MKRETESKAVAAVHPIRAALLATTQQAPTPLHRMAPGAGGGHRMARWRPTEEPGMLKGVPVHD